MGAQTESVSIVLPSLNEGINLPALIPELKQLYPEAEILVVDDGSTDNTRQVATELGACVVRHPHTMGNGAAVKTGAQHAKGEILVFMDADGQHNPADVANLLAPFADGYDMVVGARAPSGHASLHRRFANRFYNGLASLMTGFRIRDLTSGFRAVRASRFLNILYLLPNGFSYPTTSTMAFFRSGYPVTYVPVQVRESARRSNIRLLRDGTRFFLIILKIGALYSPMRLFLPVGMLLFVAGLLNYAYTYYTAGRFTNMSTLLFLSSLFTFLIGILSEQISSLHYRESRIRRPTRDDGH